MNPQENKNESATEEYDPNMTSERRRGPKCKTSKPTYSNNCTDQTDVSNKYSKTSNSKIASLNNTSNYDWTMSSDEKSYQNRDSNANSARLIVPNDPDGSRYNRSRGLSPIAPTDYEQPGCYSDQKFACPARKSEVTRNKRSGRSSAENVERDRCPRAGRETGGQSVSRRRGADCGAADDDGVDRAAAPCRRDREKRDGKARGCLRGENEKRDKYPRLCVREEDTTRSGRRRRACGKNDDDDDEKWDPDVGSYSEFEDRMLGCRPRPSKTRAPNRDDLRPGAKRETGGERQRSCGRRTRVDRDDAKNLGRRRRVGENDVGAANWDPDVGSYSEFEDRMLGCRPRPSKNRAPNRVDLRPGAKRETGGERQRSCGRRTRADRDDAKNLGRRRRVGENDVGAANCRDPDVGSYSDFARCSDSRPRPNVSVSAARDQCPRAVDGRPGSGRRCAYRDDDNNYGDDDDRENDDRENDDGSADRRRRGHARRTNCGGPRAGRNSSFTGDRDRRADDDDDDGSWDPDVGTYSEFENTARGGQRPGFATSERKSRRARSDSSGGGSGAWSDEIDFVQRQDTRNLSRVDVSDWEGDEDPRRLANYYSATVRGARDATTCASGRLEDVSMPPEMRRCSTCTPADVSADRTPVVRLEDVSMPPEMPRCSTCGGGGPSTPADVSADRTPVVRLEDVSMPPDMLRRSALDDSGWSTRAHGPSESSASRLEDVSAPRLTDSFDLWDSRRRATEDDQDQDQDVPYRGRGGSFPDIRDTSMPRDAYEDLHDEDNDVVCYCVANRRQSSNGKDQK